jgi:hypothetical protein
MGDGMFLSWLALLLLGAWHGINPGMGWLFAVALGLQEGRRLAVWGALLPLAIGHALAVGAAILVGAAIGLVLPMSHVKWVVAVSLIGFGLHRLVRHRHPRWGSMQVGPWDLTFWSFLMASAHGAGLMVLPIVLGAGFHATPASHASVAAGHAHDTTAAALEELPNALMSADVHHGAHTAALLAGVPDGQWLQVAATLVHTLAYLAITGVVAVVVYEKLGLRLLRTWWFNLDVVWAGALILTGVLTPFL